MKTLCEVMDFFVKTSGKEATKPLTCNDLTKLGFPENDYDTKIIRGAYWLKKMFLLSTVFSHSSGKKNNYSKFAIL